MSRHTASVVVTCVLIGGLISGCDQSDCAPKAIAGVYEAYSPIVLAVLPEVVPKTIPGIAVSLGLFAADALARYLIEHAVPKDKTWLLIEQTLHGQRKTSVFELATDHELKVSVNGAQLKHVDLYVKERQIKVIIPRGTAAEVTVTDAGNGDEVALRGTVPGDLDGSLDLDTGRISPDDSPGARAADIQVKTFGFDIGPKLVNGATATRFTGTGRPTLHACMSMPSTAWTSAFQDWQTGAQDRSWCVRTNAGHYGLAVPKQTGVFWIGSAADVGAVSYLLWAQPGLPAAPATAVPAARIDGC
ncbi:hypothetical protein [Nonomuraea zeae]|uniref:Uncharacterized protein n=1 Tax=Nonomuraea zeae TaxID=1642303 RepID=A0A5S4H538_9ACTN|nr:hypothetical protein [Nonomuraea zeae]TMR33980.1 hypothetical protein ETD85_18365 [Nonomuraea zeae]